MAVATTRMTAAVYLTLPPSERKTELIDGEIVVTDASFRHQRIVGELYALLRAWLLAHPEHGEAGLGSNFRLDDANVYSPDVWWVPGDRRPGRDAVWYEGSPGLAAEVRSPSTWRYDVGAKKAGYERTGLSELWLVDTVADVIRVFRRSWPEAATFDVAFEAVPGDTLTTELLPGFALDVAALLDR